MNQRKLKNSKRFSDEQKRQLLRRRMNLDNSKKETKMPPIVLTITFTPAAGGGFVPNVHGPLANWPLCFEMLDIAKKAIMQEHTRLIQEQASGIIAAPANALDEIDRSIPSTR